jgi:hypothetical protein
VSHKTAATVARSIGIDTGKNILHLIGLDDKGAIVLREKISRSQITAGLANLPRGAWSQSKLALGPLSRASRPWLRRHWGVRNDAPKFPFSPKHRF